MKSIKPKKINYILFKERIKKGRKNESLVLQALNNAANKNKLPKWIHEFYLSSYEEDQKGIDLIVNTDVGKLYLQIKSSKYGKNKFENKFKTNIKRYGIETIIVNTEESEEKLLLKILLLLKRMRKRYQVTCSFLDSQQ